MKPTGEGGFIEVECDAPRKVAVALLARRGHWLARPLTGVINAPTLRPDGSILSNPGYDPARGLLLISEGVEFSPVPERPGKADAMKALNVLKDTVKDFPFTESYDRSAALSALLTGVIRHSLRTASMHTFSAPKMAAGKSLLADIVLLITTGVPVTVTSYTEDVDEMRKRIISILVQGDLVINIDNIETPLASQTLCTVLTQEEFTDANKTLTSVNGDIHHEHETLRDALFDVCGERDERDGKLNGRKLGRYIERYEHRVEVGARFKRQGSKERYIRWCVDLVDEERFHSAQNKFRNEFQNQPETRAAQGSEANSNEFHECFQPGENFSNAKRAR